ncbi:MAG: ABC transporter substrate-binding protein [Comamonadaceae bacterium SCN 68-20]|nr:MAG: ABC transporter substrate-binding protein [Comamonadaceae bacterium SCN 68-20]OJX17306.1 MAG: ABC transporter substrate-binding protein [Burkholderiales bacterium 68-20]UJB66334.1 ABC transporter substrate-binding protein [Acidovorax sp. YS12]
MPHALQTRLSRRALLAGTAAAALPWLQAGPASAQESQIVLGQSTDLTGPLGELGSAMHQGAQAAFAAVNARGGIQGRSIVLNTLDDQYDVQKGLANARQLVADPSTFALFNCMGTANVEAMLPMVLESGIPFFAPFTGAQLSRVPQRNVFNIRASYAEEAEKLVQHLHTLGIKRIAIAYQANSFGKEVFNATQRSMAKLGLPEGPSATVENNASDAAAAAAKIAQAQPEAVLIGLAGKPAMEFVKSFRALRRGTALYGLSVLGTSANIAALGADAVGMALTQVMPLPTNPVVPVAREFVQAWKAIGAKTEPSHLALEGYINARVFCEALQRAGKNPTRASFIDATWSLRKLDLGGFEVHATEPGRNASRFVELTLVGRDGKYVR